MQPLGRKPSRFPGKTDCHPGKGYLNWWEVEIRTENKARAKREAKTKISEEVLERGTGITSRQMQEAPQGAVFIWCNGRLDYPLHLAEFLDRRDLLIVSQRWLTDQRWRGRKLSGLVVDHAARLTESERYDLRCASYNIRPTPNPRPEGAP